MKKENIRQLMLVSGDEVICEIVEFNESHEDELVVKNIYKIHSVEDHANNARYFSLRPYMCFQTGEDLFQTISEYHVMATALPTDTLMTQYKTTLKIERMTQIEIEEELEERLSRLKSMIDSDDDTEEFGDLNVIQFPPKDKLH